MSKIVFEDALSSIEGDVEHKVDVLMTHLINGCEIKNSQTGEVYCKVPPATPPLPHYLAVKPHIAEYWAAAESNLHNFQNSLWALQLLIITNPGITLSTLKNIDPDRQEKLAILEEYSYAAYQFSAHTLEVGKLILEDLGGEEVTAQMSDLLSKIQSDLLQCMKDFAIFYETQIKVVGNFNDDGTLTAEAMARVNRVGRSDYVKVEEGVVTIDFAGAASALELTGAIEGDNIGEVV